MTPWLWLGAPVVTAVVWFLVEWSRRPERAVPQRWPGARGVDQRLRVRMCVAAGVLTAVATWTLAGSVDAGRPRDGVVIVLDVSASMAANDLAPSRTAMAEAVARRVVESHRSRIGLVVFAGDAVTVAPLTTDREALQAAITEVSNAQFHPGTGSAPAAALSAALDLLAVVDGVRQIVLVSDGEWTDPRGLPAALERASSLGARVSTIGVGTASGALLTNRGGSQPAHVSRLDTEALTSIATRAGGRVFSIVDKASIDRVVEAVVAPGTPPSRRSWGTRLGLLFSMSLLVGGFNIVRREETAGTVRAWGRGLTLGLAVASAAACVDDRIRVGNEQFDAGDFAGAARRFLDAGANASASGVASFNRGIALATIGQTEEALAALEVSQRELPGANSRALAAFNRGVLFVQRNRLAEAAAAFTDALRLNHAMEDARINLTIVLHRLRSQPREPPRATAEAPAIRYVLPQKQAFRERGAVQNDW